MNAEYEQAFKELDAEFPGVASETLKVIDTEVQKAYAKRKKNLKILLCIAVVFACFVFMVFSKTPFDYILMLLSFGVLFFIYPRYLKKENKIWK
jgi:hypothetical protein